MLTHYYLNPIIYPCILQIFPIDCIKTGYSTIASCASFTPSPVVPKTPSRFNFLPVWFIFCFNLILSSLYFLQCNSICSAFSVILHSIYSSDYFYLTKTMFYLTLCGQTSAWLKLTPLLFLPFTPCALIHFCILYFLPLLSMSRHFFIISFLIIALASPLPKGIFIISLTLVDFFDILSEICFRHLFKIKDLACSLKKYILT